MNQPRIAVLTFVASVIVAASAFTTTARAQQPATPAAPMAPQPVKIGVVDLRKAYLAMSETKASNDQLKGMRGELETMGKSHQAQLEEQQNKMSHLKAESKDHVDMMDQFDSMGLKFKMDESSMQARMVRQQGRQMAHAFTEIQAAVSDLAKRKGLDLVLVNNGNDLPDNVGDISNQETLQNLIFGRSVLYVSPKIDITDEVVAAVDAAAKAGPAPVPATPGH